MPRQFRRPVHGILLLDKPQGLSSNQALQACRRLFQAAKAGHTGSLDPMATGLLPLCFGEATKVAGLLLGSRKAYVAECKLGETTRTDDAEGEVLVQREVPALDVDAIGQAVRRFIGTIDQVPPAFSALKRDGVPMYVRARRGEDVAMSARPVQIHDITLLSWQKPFLRLHITCGSGTYIRSLARDLGEALGCGAHLTALRREWVDPFTQPVMHTLDALEDMTIPQLDDLLLPVDAGLGAMPPVHLDAAASQALAHGRSVPMDMEEGRYRAYAQGGQLLALAEMRQDGCLHVLRGFNLPENGPEQT
ncbi:MAG TPA: tRNA pseudouridine(55) synthase TruB [Rhodanobacteraceae bacterium]|nr:tRNA pseudouridine(55) synthase TruB [Rhodanobacteraceae bacterium]